MVCYGIAGGVSGNDGGKSIPERIENGANEYVKAVKENYEELSDLLANTPVGKAIKAQSEKSIEEIFEGGGTLISFGKELAKGFEDPDPVKTTADRNEGLLKILTNNPIIRGIKGFFE